MGNQRGRLARSIGTALAAVLLLVAGAPEVVAQIRVTFAGSGPGAVGYVLAGGITALVSKESDGVEMTNRASKGLVENLRLVNTGQIEFGISSTTLISNALRGKRPFKQKLTNLRGMAMPVVRSIVHIVTLKSAGITDLAGLEGKRVNYGPKGSFGARVSGMVFGLAGFEKSIRKSWLRWDQGAQALVDGKVDAFTLNSPAPAPAVVKAAASKPIRIISIPADIRATLLKRFPGGFSERKVAAGTYQNQSDPATTLLYAVFPVANKDTPAKAVYETLRVSLTPGGQKFLRTVHPALKAIAAAPDMASMVSLGLKLHPGAVKYWREQGVAIPAAISD